MNRFKIFIALCLAFVLAGLCIVAALSYATQQSYTQVLQYFISGINYQNATQSFTRWGIVLYLLSVAFKPAMVGLLLPLLQVAAKQLQQFSRLQYGAAVLLATIIFGSCILSLQYHQGFTVYDDGDYLRYACQLAKGHLPVDEDFHAKRILVYAPVALAIKLFGFGKWLTLVTTVEYALLLLLTYLGTKHYSKNVALVMVGLMALVNPLMQYSSALLGEVLTVLTVNAPLLVYFRMRCAQSSLSTKQWALIAALFVVAAVFVKESIAYYLPAFIYFTYTDRKDKELKFFWDNFRYLLVIFAAVIMILSTVLTFNPFYRLDSPPIDNNWLQNISYHQAPVTAMLARATYKPLLMMLQSPVWGLLLLLAALNFFTGATGWARKFARAYLLITLPVWWWGSLSLGLWNPLPLVIRLWMPLLIPLALNAAMAWQSIFTMLEKKYQGRLSVVTILFMVMVIVLLQLDSSNNQRQMLSLWYGISAALVLCAVWWPVLKAFAYLPNYPQVTLLLLALYPTSILITNFVQYQNNHPACSYDQERAAVLRIAQMPVKPDIILTDGGLAYNYGIYNGFTATLPFYDWADTVLEKTPPNTWLLTNKTRLGYYIHAVSEVDNTPPIGNIPYFALKPEQFGFKKEWEEELNVLYKRK